VIMVIYADNSGEPGSLIWNSSATSYGSAVTWATEIVNHSLSGTYLWIGFFYETASSHYYYTSNSPVRDCRYTTGETFPNPPASWNVDGDAVSEYGMSMYLSY